MGYLALYRRYRPDTFGGVVGQDHIVKTLKNQILSGRVSHAYLFCGTRGTGKTSTAKIFAKAINCLDLKEGEPCGECELCRSLEAGRSVNVIEIDAASNNGVDNIREIRQEVKYPPTEGKFKVYIIDEVHMLSSGAFNALLKTLEEPPEHVIFILATTDPQKVPATILSRCQRFDFKRISAGEIAKTLKDYTTRDNILITDNALDYIARLADGSMRDSLSILDQCISFFYGEEITAEKVGDIVGAVDDSVFFQMTDSLIHQNAKEAFETIDEITANGRDIKQFVLDLTEHLRNLLVCATVSEAYGILNMSDETVDRLTEQAKKVSVDELIYFISAFSRLGSEMRYTANERILLEVEILKLCSPSGEKNIDSIAARLTGLERKVEEGVPVNLAAAPVSAPAERTKAEKPKVKKVRPALPEDIQKAMNYWDEVVQSMETVEKMIFSQGRIAYKEDGRLTVVLSEGAVALGINKIPVVKKAYEQRFGREFEVQVISEERFEEWETAQYGALVPQFAKEEDSEFDSIMNSYFPDGED